MVASMKAKVVTGPQATDEERLTLLALRGVETTYVLTMLPGAVLAPSALLELHRAAIDAGADLVYSDEDHVRDGVRCDPLFKPGASPDLMRASNYVGPVYLLRLGSAWLDDCPDGSSLYRIVLEHLRGDAVVRRVPRVLVHWHGRRDLELSRRQLGDVAEQTSGNPRLASEHASVIASIIVPTRDRLDLLQQCVSSIYAHQYGFPFEVLVLDNRSEEPETLRWLASAPGEWPARHE